MSRNGDKLESNEDVRQFLAKRGVRVDEGVVRKVVETLRGKTGLTQYDLYAHGEYRDGRGREPICGKGTVKRIKDLFKRGDLDLYVAYLDSLTELKSEDEGSEQDRAGLTASITAPSAPEKGGTKADVELGPHGRELFYFGQRLRDLADVPWPNKVVKMTAEEYEGAMWEGWPRGALANPPRDAEEEAVAREWGSGRRDARTHSLFVGFQQHLSGHECWESLDRMDAAFKKYVHTCPAAYEAILKHVRDRLPSVSEEREKKEREKKVEVLAESLLLDGFSRKRGWPGINFTYDPHEARQEGLPRWKLTLGDRFILSDDQAELKTLADVHRQLRASLPDDTDLTALAEAEHSVSEAVAAFRGSLRPDALLRKLVVSSHCDLCL